MNIVSSQRAGTAAWQAAVIFVSYATAIWAATPATQPDPTLPTLAVHKRASTTEPRIDASADDPAWNEAAGSETAGSETAWNSAAAISSLELCNGSPAKGMRPTPTQVRVLWNDQYLFVRFIAQDDDLYAPLGTAKNVLHSGGDVVEIFLDPVGDSRQFFEFQCNPVGGWADGLHVLTTQPTSGSDGVLSPEVIRRDSWFVLGWDVPGLRIAAAAFNENQRHGWIADFALPAKPILHRLGLTKFQPLDMRINFVRYDAAHPDTTQPSKTIEMAWSPVAWGRPHRSPMRMGNLSLIN